MDGGGKLHNKFIVVVLLDVSELDKVVELTNFHHIRIVLHPMWTSGDHMG
jgi:hypothetical protein